MLDGCIFEKAKGRKAAGWNKLYKAKDNPNLFAWLYSLPVSNNFIMFCFYEL
jgi:hypothetical protein